MADAKKPAAPKGAPSTIGRLYEKKGDTLTRKNKHCPKCGAGVFMAHHADRWYCGGCKYVEFAKNPKDS
jgi:small subunit ribosomal protein S27Ae